MSRESIGAFEQLVLLAILRLEENAYGIPILEEVQRHSARTVLRPAVYVALRRLGEKGLVQSRSDDASVRRRGRPRRYFEVTGEGLERLRDSRETLLSMWDGLQGALDRP